jgi:hypothetical protein
MAYWTRAGYGFDWTKHKAYSEQAQQDQGLGDAIGRVSAFFGTDGSWLVWMHKKLGLHSDFMLHTWDISMSVSPICVTRWFKLMATLPGKFDGSRVLEQASGRNALSQNTARRMD